MDKLQNLIKKYDKPDALCDHWDQDSQRFAVWGFSETFIIDCNGMAYLNGKLVKGNCINILQDTINSWKRSQKEIAALGYFSYDFKNILFAHIDFKKNCYNTPLVWFGKPKQVIPYKIEKNKVSNKNTQLINILDIPNPKEYQRSIEKIKHYLKNGDSYQINFTQPKKYETNLKSFDLYMDMRSNILPHYGFYLNTGIFQILSFSPERFFKTKNNIIDSFPMKGTRPRSLNSIKDISLAKELSNSIKDKAEHLMIVDLVRNDLGKICKYGSVKVKDLYKIKSFETVHQMESNINGVLKDQMNEMKIIKALFPGGSITGAPKEESMKIIDSIENYNRGVYTGAIGYIDSIGNMDFNIGIRTMIINNSIATYPVGGGIVWDSDSLEEWKEAKQKSLIIDNYDIKVKQVLESF